MPLRTSSSGSRRPGICGRNRLRRRIAEARPDAQIIAILREPASYLRSLHLQFLRTDIENEPDFRSALELEGERKQGRRMPRSSTRPQLLLYSEHVRYVEQLRRYHAVFPREQVLVLIYEDFRADNEGTVRRIERFLGVDDTVPVEPVTVNPAAGVRSARLNWLVRSVYIGGHRGRAYREVGDQVRHLTTDAPRRARGRAPRPGCRFPARGRSLHRGAAGALPRGGGVVERLSGP